MPDNPHEGVNEVMEEETTQKQRSKNRVQAKEQVRQVWHERRQERRHASGSSLSRKTQNNNPFAIPSLCAVLKKTWNEQVKQQQQQPQPRPKNTNRQQRSNSHQQGQSFFPSVLSVLQAYALVQQVEGWNESSQEDEEEHEEEEASNVKKSIMKQHSNEEDDEVSHSAASTALEQAVLSVWPSDYDWNQAIWQTAQSRSRVFLLLDLTAIVRRLVLWKQFYKVKFLYNVQANPDSKLLQVLIKSKCIQLVTSSKADIARVSDIAASLSVPSSLATQTQNPYPLVYDSTLRRTGPPDGYIRELVWTANVRTIAVTHVDDIARIRNTLRRIQQRRRHCQLRSANYESAGRLTLDFMLVLNEQNNVHAWPSFVQSCLEEINRQPTSVCAGLSFHVGPAHEWTSRQETVEQLVRHIHQYYSSDDKDAPLLRIDITGLVQDPFPTEWTSWWDRMLHPLDDSKKNNKIMVGEITVDGTTPLVATMGALCTRIIGVRQDTTKDHEKNENEAAVNDEDCNIRRHYYIDDGCYGSLSHVRPSENDRSDNLSASCWNPLPLRPHTGNDAPVYSSTIWGPTCDGLDRVCSNIPLPRLERDDWLVFPNRGCSLDQTTGFNGFDPPDTAFCVLEYFQ